MIALVEVIIPDRDGGGEVAVAIAPGPGGAAALATLLEGGCPVCTAPLDGDGRCGPCSEARGPVRYVAVAEDGGS